MVSPAAGPWPMYGRDDDIAAVADWFARPDVGGVILGGDAGVGKSALAIELGRVLPSTQILRVVANPALTTVPYGAIAHALPPDLVDGDGAIDRGAVLQSLARAEGRTVVVADDPGDLDEGSLGLIAQLIISGVGFLVATVRTDAFVPPAITGLERTSNVRRLAVEPLDAGSIEALLASVLAGPVAAATLDVFASASAGNPLYLRELVDHAVASHTLVVDSSGEWRLTGELQPGRGLADVVAARLGVLPTDALEVAKMLVLGAPMRWSMLEVGGFADAAGVLEQSGVAIAHDGTDPTVELAHPLYGEILRAGIGVLERRRLLGVLIRWLDRPGASIDERLKVADWQLSIGVMPDVGSLEEGARRAWSGRDHAAAERFARAALEQRPSMAMGAILVEALIHTGRPDEADAAAADLLDRDDRTSSRARSRLVGLRVFNDLWYRERPDDAAAVVAAERREHLDPVADDELLIQEAYVAHARADARSVLDLVRHRDWTEEIAPQGLLLTAQILADTGNALEGRTVIEAAARAASGAAMTVSTAGSIDAASVRLFMLAGDLDAADAAIAALRSQDEYRTDAFIRGHLHLSAGRIALSRGRPLTARQQFAAGRSIGEQHANRVTIMACAAGQAVAAAYLRDEMASRELLAELETFELARVVRPSIATGMAWTLSVLGDPARARELLVTEVAHSAGRGELTDAALLAHDLVRLGGASDARRLLDELSPQVDGLAALLCDAGIAMVGSSLDELGVVESRAAAIGLALLAAELAAAADRAARRAGDRRAATAAQRRVTEHLESCEGATTPGVVVIDTVSPLSDREREIASLAADGLSNQDIADRLHVSVRTVGNHLQHVYVKLGIVGRSDLAEVLGR